jgi:hypothetical protein
VQEKETLVEGLDLMPGYHAERDGADINLVDSRGDQVARLPGRVVSKNPAPPDQEWQDLFEALLMLVRSHAVECEVLRERVRKLEKRLGEVEAERDASDRIAGTLYEFFSRTTQRVAKQKQASEKGSNGGWTKNGGPEAGLPGSGPRRTSSEER